VEPSPRARWFLLAFAIASVSVSSTLLLYAREAPPLVLSFHRLLFATLLLAPAALWFAKKEAWLLTGRQFLLLAFVGFLLAAHFATWVTSIFYTSVASSVVLVTTEALWVPLGAYFLLKESIGRRVWVGVGVAFTGSVVLVLGDLGETRFGPNALIGDALALAAAFAASGYFLIGRRLRQRMGLLAYATIVYGFATIFLFLFVLITDQKLGPFRPDTYLFLFLFALIPMVFGHTVINYILRWVQPHVVSTAILTEPVVSSVLALLLFAQSPSALVWIGGLIILAGILLATLGTEQPLEPAGALPPPPSTP
jgi:drug/metabolite transporter (DMT)-like permease